LVGLDKDQKNVSREIRSNDNDSHRNPIHVPGSSGLSATATKREPKQNSRGRHNVNLFLWKEPERKFRILRSIAIAARQLEGTFKQRHRRFHFISA